MARRNTKKDEALARLIDARFLRDGDARASRETVVDKAREDYEPGYVDKTKVKRPPYVKLGYDFNTVNFKTAQLIAASEANALWVQARSTTPEGGDVGEIVTQALEHQFRWKSSDSFSDNEEVLERDAQGGNLSGNSYLHCQWYEDGDEWGVRFEFIPWRDMFKDSRHGPSGRWYTIRKWITLAELNDIVEGDLSAPVRTQVGVDEAGEPVFTEEPRDGGHARRQFRKLLKQVKDGQRVGSVASHMFATSADPAITLNRVSDDSSSDGDDGDTVKDDPFNARVELIHHIETHKRGLVVLMVPGCGGHADPLIFRKEVNPYRVCTIAEFMPFPIDNEAYGYGYPEIIGQLSQVLDYMLRMQLRMVAQHGDAALQHRRGSRIRRDFLASPTGKAVEVDDIGTALGYLTPPSSSGLFNFALQIGKQAADLVTGMSESKRGNPTGEETATAAAIAESSASVLDKLLFKRWRKHIEKIGQITLAILKVHITEEKAIAWMGRDADTLLKLRPEFLKGTFEVEFGGSEMGMNPQQEISSLVNFGQAFGASGVVDMAALARLVARKIGIRNPDKILLADVGRPKVSARHENIAVFDFGQEPEVHPQDDHLQHLLAHQKHSAKVAQENQFHPGLPVMGEHMQQHQLAYQQQQLAAQQQAGPAAAQAPPGGLVPGPGNPQVVTPATQQGVDARQLSNQNANGGAPGGAAIPNRLVGQIQQGPQPRS